MPKLPKPVYDLRALDANEMVAGDSKGALIEVVKAAYRYHLGNRADPEPESCSLCAALARFTNIEWSG